jgi:hypothetical protein
LKHTSIDPKLADAWKLVQLPNPLGDWAQRVAALLEYELPNEKLAGAPVGSTDEFEEERL